jgi:ketosteroid isomerase-like protein
MQRKKVAGMLGVQMSGLDVLWAAYFAWAEGDLAALLDLVADDIVFAVNVPAGVKSYVGKGMGKDAFARGLERLLRDWEVIEFTPLPIKPRGLWLRAQVSYCYKARGTGLEIDGTMRHLWRVVDGKIVHFELLHDAPRMDAFRRLAQAEPHI